MRRGKKYGLESSGVIESARLVHDPSGVFEAGRKTIRSTASTVSEHELSAGQQSVVRTLLYYHIFDYPMSAEEVRRFSSHPWHDLAEIENALGDLVERSLIGADRGFFYVGEHSHVDELVADRARARSALQLATRWSRYIARFPYVRGVAVSGTLSKGVMKEGDDLDYLVFTEPNRVWLCRLLLMGFKKIFLLNSHHRFCINYLLAADRLEIPDHDVFTATEIASLLPTVNPSIHDRFLKANSWVEEYFPNWDPRCDYEIAQLSRGVFKNLAEGVADFLGGRRLDDWSHRLISRRNSRRYGHLDVRHEVALRSEKHASKHHPRGFQERVLGRLDDEIAGFEERHGVLIRDQQEAGS